MVFVETPVINRRILECMDDEEYGQMQAYLNLHPEAGKVIKGAGGIRKLRRAGSGRGKRGGLRVIYYWWAAKDRISLLLVYPKNERDDLTASQVKQLKSELIP